MLSNYQHSWNKWKIKEENLCKAGKCKEEPHGNLDLTSTNLTGSEDRGKKQWI